MAYNGKIIRQLIEEAGMTPRQFSDIMFKDSKKNDLFHVEHSKSVNCSTLERMREVLHCSMDRFFTIPDWEDDAVPAAIAPSDVPYVTRLNQANKEIDYLNELLNEKDERIKLLNQLLTEKNKSEVGRNSDGEA